MATDTGVERIDEAVCDGERGSVIAVSSHAPAVVHKGDTIAVTLWAN